MRFSTILALAAPLTGMVSGLNFTSPALNATLNKGSTFNLTWSHVDTDPQTFSIYLVNFVDWPPFYTPVAFDVSTCSNSTQVRVPCNITSSYGFQFNAINGTNTYIIYAQTPKFSTGGADCVDPAPGPACPAQPTASEPAGHSVKSRRKTRIVPKEKRAAVIGWGAEGYDAPVVVEHFRA